MDCLCDNKLCCSKYKEEVVYCHHCVLLSQQKKQEQLSKFLSKMNSIKCPVCKSGNVTVSSIGFQNKTGCDDCKIQKPIVFFCQECDEKNNRLFCGYCNGISVYDLVKDTKTVVSDIAVKEIPNIVNEMRMFSRLQKLCGDICEKYYGSIIEKPTMSPDTSQELFTQHLAFLVSMVNINLEIQQLKEHLKDQCKSILKMM